VRFVVMALFSVSIRQHLHSSGNFSGVRERHHFATRSIQYHSGPVLHVRPLQACLKSGAQSSFLPDVRFEIRLCSLLMYSWGVVGAVHISRACLSIEAIRPDLVSSRCTLGCLQLRQVPKIGPEETLIPLTCYLKYLI